MDLVLFMAYRVGKIIRGCQINKIYVALVQNVNVTGVFTLLLFVAT